MRVGDYELGEELGAGGMAKVYKARHVVLDTLHAVKVLDPKLVGNVDARTRFVDEGRIQAKHLDHPNIVKVTNVISSAEQAALVMELIEGTGLDAEIQNLKTRPGEVVRIMLGILEGVGYAHANGIIHRDLKPGNVLLARKDGKLIPKVTDFGIAKVLAPDAASTKKQTHADSRMGTLTYMSPEQLRSAKDVTQRSDVFSLGAMLYEMATGVQPFEGESDYTVMDAIIKGRYEPPTKYMPQLGPNIIYAIEKALRTDPARRFESCAEMAGALRGVTQHAAKPAATAPAATAPAAKPAETKTASAPPAAKAASKPSEPKLADPKATTKSTEPPAPKATTSPPSKPRSNKVLGIVLLVVALGVGGVAVALALKGEGDAKPAAPNNGSGSSVGGGAKLVDPLAMPADARELAGGIRYVFLSPPDPTGSHPQRGDMVHMRLTNFEPDGSRRPVEMTDNLGTSVGELVPLVELLTTGASLRAWVPRSDQPKGLWVVEIELVSNAGGAIPPPPAPRNAPSAPAPAKAAPVQAAPPASSASGEVICVSGGKMDCGSNPGKRQKWHFHGYVQAGGECYACWDEESSTCEQVAAMVGWRFIGADDCGGIPESTAPPRLLDGKTGRPPQAPPPLPPPPPTP